MDYAGLKKHIKEYACSIGISKIGFADAAPLNEHIDRLRDRQKASYSYAINEGDPGRRINPALHLPGAKSVICIAVVYPTNKELLLEHLKSEELEELKLNPGPRGRVSLISRGPDYHKVVAEKLNMLEKLITREVPDAKTVTMVDKEELLEKALAVRAGLGWFGKNTLLVTPEYGSFVSLGEIITNLPFPPDEPLVPGCGSCQKCLQACPTRAIGNDANLNPDLCLAGISQYKGIISHGLRLAMGSTIYGCDLCQLACPYNMKVLKNAGCNHGECARESAEIEEKEFENAYPLIQELIALNNADFKKRFGNTSGAWRGRAVYQRNAIIAAGNQKDDTLVPILLKTLKEDNRPVLRATAAWALGQIGGTKTREGLLGALKEEQEISVVDEIKKALSSDPQKRE